MFFNLTEGTHFRRCQTCAGTTLHRKITTMIMQDCNRSLTGLLFMGSDFLLGPHRACCIKEWNIIRISLCLLDTTERHIPQTLSNLYRESLTCRKMPTLDQGQGGLEPGTTMMM